MRCVEAIEKRLGVSFNDPALLRLALVHSSYLNENPGEFPESNERLEFLGDALLGLVVADEVYRRYPTRPEGGLTALRSALVRGETLARIAESLGLGESLLMGRGEDAGGGRERQSNLAAAFEAMVGAVFQDQGYDAAHALVLGVMAAELDALTGDDVPANPKSALQELVQGRGEAPPSYRVARESGKDHARRFDVEVLVSGKVMGRGSGGRRSQAEQEAAQEALKALGSDTEKEFSNGDQV